MSSITESGISNIGKIPWGSHFCQLYADKCDLAQVLLPYFVAGLVNHERCVWITAQPYGIEQANASLNEALPEFKRMKSRGQITICGFEDWYLAREPSTETTLDRWVNEERRALENGYSGLRISGNTSFVDQRAWAAFMDYEKRVQTGLHGRRVIALCSYDRAKIEPGRSAEVWENHHFRITRNQNFWEVLD